ASSCGPRSRILRMRSFRWCYPTKQASWGPRTRRLLAPGGTWPPNLSPPPIGAGSKLVSVEGWRWEEDGHGLAVHVLRRLTYRTARLVPLLLSVATLLFILVRLSTSPASLLAGAGASPAQVQAAGAAYGLDGPMLLQYITFMVRGFRLDFGRSPAHQAAALELVRLRLPATLLLTAAALAAPPLLALPPP